MTSRVTASGYVLHSRPYRESSLLLTLYTAETGLVAAVARGARGRKGHGLLPFRMLRLSWVGRTSLVTMTGHELIEMHPLTGRALGAGLYLNEIIVRLVREQDAAPALFDAYRRTLAALAAGGSLEAPLRRFEKVLLEQIGYALDFGTDSVSGEPIDAQHRYTLDIDVGFHVAEDGFPGAHLIAIGRGDLEEPDVRRTAKVLFRRALRPHLGHKPLVSRTFFTGAPGRHSAVGRGR